MNRRSQNELPRLLALAFAASLAATTVVAEQAAKEPQEVAAWFSFPREEDTRAESILDRFRPAATPAGAHGPAAVKDGHFVFDNGDRLRFWGINIEKEWQQYTKPMIDEFAARAARLGIGCVRFYPLDSCGGLQIAINQDGRVVMSAEKLDVLEYFIARLKKEGIYVTLCLTWFGFDDQRTKTRADGLHMLTDSSLRRYYQQYIRDLLLHRNPYTGRTNGEEFAILFAQLANESNLLFWNGERTYRLPPGKKRWHAWLRNRYQTDEGLKAAWGSAIKQGESLEKETVELLDTWNLQLPSQPSEPLFRRKTDQGRFVTEYQLESYLRMKEYIQKELGSPLLINGSPWCAPGWLDALDEFTNARAGVLCRHGYWDHPAGGWTADGSTHHNQPMIRNLFSEGPSLDGQSSTVHWFGSRRAAGVPFVGDEFQTCAPNDYRLEGTLLLACTAALQDWDGLNQFAITHIDRGDRLYRNSVFECTDPCILAQFPIASLILRGGYLRAGDLAWRDCIPESELYNPGRKLETPAERILVGRCERFYGEGDDVKPAVNAYVSADRSTVKSNTGELQWRKDPGVLLVSARRLKGYLGFADGEEHDLGDLKMKIHKDFVSVFVASLDEGDVNTSKTLFLHAVGQTKNTGQGPHALTGRTVKRIGTPELKIENAGTTPILMKAVRAAITFARPVKAVYALDMSGRRKEQVPLVNGTGFELDIAKHQAVWYEIVR